MSKLMLKCSTAALVVVFAGATLDVAEAGSNSRKQRSGSGQMMRLGGPTNGATVFVDRTGGPSLRTNSEIKAFFDERTRQGNGRQ